MQYFLSIENTSYHHWQTELLIESFKYHGIEDQLHIAIANYTNPVIPDYKKNIIAHKNKYVHIPISRKMNRICSLLWLLSEGILKQPFVVIHADMVLACPVAPFEERFVFCENHENDLLLNALASYLKPVFKEQDRMGYLWMPFGDVLGFNDMPIQFFEQAQQWLAYFNKKQDNFNIERAAWHLTLANNKPTKARCLPLEQTMMDSNIKANFIHYKKGILPMFHKKYYIFNENDNFMPTEQDPFDAIYKNTINGPTDFMKTLVENYRSTL